MVPQDMPIKVLPTFYKKTNKKYKISDNNSGSLNKNIYPVKRILMNFRF